MEQFIKPKNLNGAELLAELKAAGIDADKPTINDDNVFTLEIDSKDIAKAKPIIECHNGTVIAPEPSIDQKLASVGLSIDDLKTALGL